jgi:hypothetical protein
VSEYERGYRFEVRRDGLIFDFVYPRNDATRPPAYSEEASAVIDEIYR